MMVLADRKISDDEAQLMCQLTHVARDGPGVVDDDLRDLVDLDIDEVWRCLDSASGDLPHLVCQQVARVDGGMNKQEQAAFDALRSRLRDRVRTRWCAARRRCGTRQAVSDTVQERLWASPRRDLLSLQALGSEGG